MNTALGSFLRYLATGNRVTSKQARTLFKVQNVADLAYRARNIGIAVYTNKVVNSRGLTTFAYKIGIPTKTFENYLDSGHLARARKTLYRDAISVSMKG